jgi:23S rRNA (cytosine1962-C5)-methyltransferase
MKSAPYPVVHLHKGREKSLLKGHPWLFSGAIAAIDSPLPANGEPVRICSSSGSMLGVGFYNALSDIAVRMLSTDP